MSLSPLRVIAALCVLALMGAVILKLRMPGNGAALRPATSAATNAELYPATMGALLDEADVVVRGRQEAFTFAGFFSHYDETGQAVWRADPATALAAGGALPQSADPTTRMSLRVTEVFSGSVQAGDVLPVLVGGSYEPEAPCNPSAYMAFRNQGDEYLFFLALEPDGRSYGVPYGNVGRLDLSGADVEDTGCPPGPVLFTDHRDPGAFLDELKELIASR